MSKFKNMIKLLLSLVLLFNIIQAKPEMDETDFKNIGGKKEAVAGWSTVATDSCAYEFKDILSVFSQKEQQFYIDAALTTKWCNDCTGVTGGTNCCSDTDLKLTCFDSAKIIAGFQKVRNELADSMGKKMGTMSSDYNKGLACFKSVLESATDKTAIDTILKEWGVQQGLYNTCVAGVIKTYLNALGARTKFLSTDLMNLNVAKKDATFWGITDTSSTTKVWKAFPYQYTEQTNKLCTGNTSEICGFVLEFQKFTTCSATLETEFKKTVAAVNLSVNDIFNANQGCGIKKTTDTEAMKPPTTCKCCPTATPDCSDGSKDGKLEMTGTPAKASCTCDTGYVWNTTEQTKAANASSTNTKSEQERKTCKCCPTATPDCTDGSKDGKLTMDNSTPPKASCTCDSGYVWNTTEKTKAAETKPATSTKPDTQPSGGASTKPADSGTSSSSSSSASGPNGKGMRMLDDANEKTSTDAIKAWDTAAAAVKDKLTNLVPFETIITDPLTLKVTPNLLKTLLKNLSEANAKVWSDLVDKINKDNSCLDSTFDYAYTLSLVNSVPTLVCKFGTGGDETKCDTATFTSIKNTKSLPASWGVAVTCLSKKPAQVTYTLESNNKNGKIEFFAPSSQVCEDKVKGRCDKSGLNELVTIADSTIPCLANECDPSSKCYSVTNCMAYINKNFLKNTLVINFNSFLNLCDSIRSTTVAFPEANPSATPAIPDCTTMDGTGPFDGRLRLRFLTTSNTDGFKINNTLYSQVTPLPASSTSVSDSSVVISGSTTTTAAPVDSVTTANNASVVLIQSSGNFIKSLIFGLILAFLVIFS